MRTGLTRPRRQAEPLVQAIGDGDGVAAVVAYTHDLSLPNGERSGNLYFEMNNQLRERSAAARASMLATWGVPVHYTLKAMSKLPDVARVCYRGFAHADAAGKEELLGRILAAHWSDVPAILRVAPEELKKDREFVLAAVPQKPNREKEGLETAVLIHSLC